MLALGFVRVGKHAGGGLTNAVHEKAAVLCCMVHVCCNVFFLHIASAARTGLDSYLCSFILIMLVLGLVAGQRSARGAFFFPSLGRG